MPTTTFGLAACQVIGSVQEIQERFAFQPLIRRDLIFLKAATRLEQAGCWRELPNAGMKLEFQHKIYQDLSAVKDDGTLDRLIQMWLKTVYQCSKNSIKHT